MGTKSQAPMTTLFIYLDKLNLVFYQHRQKNTQDIIKGINSETIHRNMKVGFFFKSVRTTLI